MSGTSRGSEISITSASSEASVVVVASLCAGSPTSLRTKISASSPNRLTPRSCEVSRRIFSPFLFLKRLIGVTCFVIFRGGGCSSSASPRRRADAENLARDGGRGKAGSRRRAICASHRRHTNALEVRGASMKEDEAGKKCNEDGSDGLGKCDACSNFRDRPNSAIALSRVRRVIVRRPRALLQSSILNVGICIKWHLLNFKLDDASCKDLRAGQTRLPHGVDDVACAPPLPSSAMPAAPNFPGPAR